MFKVSVSEAGNGLRKGLVQSEDFIPAPTSPAPQPQAPSLSALPIEITNVGLDTTKLILGIAIVLVLAAVLFFVRSGIKNALVSNKASLDAANFAGWSWFLYLLLVLSLVVFGLLGGFFSLLPFAITTGSIAVSGLIACAVIHGNARSTRK